VNFFKKTDCKNLMLRLCGAFFLIPPTVDTISIEFDETRVPLENIETFEQNVDHFKTPREVDAYFIKLKGRKNKNMQAYFNEYRPLLLSASNTFDLPFSFQSCLIFKESRFNKKAVSHVGALGVAQFMKNTYSFLGKALYSGKKLLESEGKTILEVETFGPFEEAKPLTLSSIRMQREIYKKMYLKWIEYLDENNLDEIDLSKIHYKSALGIPEYAIVFSSMYLYYLKQRVEQKLASKISEKDLMNPELYLSFAGAYNQGAGRLFRVIKRNNKGINFAKWTNYQSRVGETKKYISSIRNCMISDRGVSEPKRVASREDNRKGQL
jgi:hypothetical protein